MNNKKGFTLVELLAVIVILGVLTAIAVPSVLGISKKIKTDMYDSKIKTIEVAAELWADDHKSDCLSQINTLQVGQLIPDYLKADDNSGNFNSPTDGTSLKGKSLNDLGINVACPKSSEIIITDLKSYNEKISQELTDNSIGWNELTDGVKKIEDCKSNPDRISLYCASLVCTKCSSLSKESFKASNAGGTYGQYRIRKIRKNLEVYRALYNVKIGIWLDGNFKKYVTTSGQTTDNDNASEYISNIGARGYQITAKDDACSIISYDEENDELDWVTSGTLTEDLVCDIFFEKY